MSRPISLSGQASLWTVGFLLAACEPEPEPEPGLSGTHVVFHFEAEGPALCAGSVAHLDRHVERVLEFFEVPDTADFRVPIRLTDDPPCGDACYLEGEVHVRDFDRAGRRPGAVLRHELAHAVVDHVWGRSIPFFSEGLAESFSRTLDEPYSFAPDEMIGAMLDRPASEVDYAAAARFTRFLIDTRGLARFKQLYLGATERSQTAVRKLFEAVYDEAFEALESEFLASSRRCQYQLDVCDPAAAVSVQERWSLSLAASCLSPEFYGSEVSGEPVMAAQRTVEIDVAGVYRLRAATEVFVPSQGALRFTRLLFTRCGECDEQFVTIYHGADVELPLEAGLYGLEFLPGGDSVVGVELEYLGPHPDPP